MVDAQVVGVEELGQVVQDAGVRVPEFVERLGTIRFDAYLEKNSTNFSCFVLKAACFPPFSILLTIPFCLSYLTEYYRKNQDGQTRRFALAVL